MCIGSMQCAHCSCNKVLSTQLQAAAELSASLLQMVERQVEDSGHHVALHVRAQS